MKNVSLDLTNIWVHKNVGAKKVAVMFSIKLLLRQVLVPKLTQEYSSSLIIIFIGAK